jgi:hypothetical protein
MGPSCWGTSMDPHTDVTQNSTTSSTFPGCCPSLLLGRRTFCCKKLRPTIHGQHKKVARLKYSVHVVVNTPNNDILASYSMLNVHRGVAVKPANPAPFQPLSAPLAVPEVRPRPSLQHSVYGE